MLQGDDIKDMLGVECHKKYYQLEMKENLYLYVNTYSLPGR